MPTTSMATAVIQNGGMSSLRRPIRSTTRVPTSTPSTAMPSLTSEPATSLRMPSAASTSGEKVKIAK
jgi:hypothetical protein